MEIFETSKWVRQFFHWNTKKMEMRPINAIENIIFAFISSNNLE